MCVCVCVCVCVGGGGEFDNELSISVVSGLKPSTPAKPHGSLTKQEIAEVCRRKSVEEREETGEERMK